MSYESPGFSAKPKSSDTESSWSAPDVPLRAPDVPLSAPDVPLAETEAPLPAPESLSFRAHLRSIGRLPNHLVSSELLQLSRQQHQLEAELLLFLGELDRRQLYREHAVSSAFEFCVLRLGYSEDVAWKRVGAARMIRRFPHTYELLVEGRIHLSALMLIKPHLTDANHEEWLSLACGKSKRQIEKLVAARCPRPDAPASIRKYPDVRATVPAVVEHEAIAPREIDRAATEPAAAAATPVAVGTASAPAPARLLPLSTSTYRISFTSGERLKQKLDRAGELLGHSIRPSDLPALLERAVDCLLEQEGKRRFGARPSVRARSSKLASSDGSSNSQSIHQRVQVQQEAQHEPCQKSSPMTDAAQDPAPVCRVGVQPNLSSRSAKPEGAKPKPKRRRHIQVAVKYAVFERDGGQCTYVDLQGRRCTQRHGLEFDHIDAHALGGGESVSELRLLCKCHNQLEAERLFGRERVKAAVKHAKRQRARDRGAR